MGRRNEEEDPVGAAVDRSPTQTHTSFQQHRARRSGDRERGGTRRIASCFFVEVLPEKRLPECRTGQVSETGGADGPAIEECGSEKGRASWGTKGEVPAFMKLVVFATRETDKPAHHHAGRIDEPHRFHQPHSLVLHVRLWGRGGVGKDALPGAWATCGALKRRSSSGQAKRASSRIVSHTLCPSRVGLIGCPAWIRTAGWLNPHRLALSGRKGFSPRRPETRPTRDIMNTTDNLQQLCPPPCWLRILFFILLIFHKCRCCCGYDCLVTKEHSPDAEFATRNGGQEDGPRPVQGIEVNSASRIQTILT